MPKFLRHFPNQKKVNCIMLEQIDLTKILVLDIETVPQTESFDELNDTWKDLWLKKAQLLKKEEGQTDLDIYPRAGIYAEFGKIVCISCGFFVREGNQYAFRIKSFSSENEIEILEGFTHLVNHHFSGPGFSLCAHNGKEFDFPFIARRCLLNALPIPQPLNIAGKKPWEVNLLDSMELWKFGDYKSFTSLVLLATAFGIPTPKDDIDGSMVGMVFWKEKDIERIKTYCQKDVITVAQILLKYKLQPLLETHQIQYV